MQIKSQNTGFYGKRDILYNLRCGALAAIEYSRKDFLPADVIRTYDEADRMFSNKTMIYAYLDSACHDDKFKSTIENIDKPNLRFLANLLKKLECPKGIAYPIIPFKECLIKMYEKHWCHNTADAEKFINDFIDKLKISINN